MIVHSGLARHVSVLMGYLYPALASAKTAVQQDPAAFKQWMTYWVVISVFAMVEMFVDFFVSWVPFYYEAKIVLIVWLTLPRYQGASQIYHRLLHPYMEQYEGEIDNGLDCMRVGAARRIQAMGTTAATEIAKAVTNQGTTVKEQLFARVLGIAATAVPEKPDDRPAAQSSASWLQRRAIEGETRKRQQQREEEEEEVAAANASMLLDFTGVMEGGLFVQARSSFTGGDVSDDEPWRPQKIRLLEGTTFCMASDGMDVDGGVDGGRGGGRGGGVSYAGEGERFEVLAAEAGSVKTPEASLLLLRTDRGPVEVSLPAKEDRDSMLVGFELLLASVSQFARSAAAAASEEERTAKFRGTLLEGRNPGRRVGGLGREESRRWEISEGKGGGGGMMLESADDETEDEHRDGRSSPGMVSPRHDGWEEVG